MKKIFKFTGKHFMYTFIAIAVIFTVFASSVYGFVKVAGSSSAEISIPEVKQSKETAIITPKPTELPTVKPIANQTVQPIQASNQEPTFAPGNSGSQNRTREDSKESDKRDSSYEVKTSSGSKFNEDKDVENVHEDEEKNYENSRR